ncbi:MAG: 6-phosphofructokinase [bacterium]|nr:6-phosphofructokinase [bacterium]
MKRIGVLTGGGDAAGMNAAVRAVVRTALTGGAEVVGIQRGWLGLSEADAKPMTSRDVAGILHTGGTVLRTFRYPDFTGAAGQEKVGRALKKLKLDGMVIIGGDGSFRGGAVLDQKFDLPVMGVPATIDNDIPGTDFSIGFDTALNIAVDAVDKIRDTASSHGRIFVIEVMGRSCGLLAMEAGLSTGAEEVIVPEIPFDLDAICQRIEGGYDRGKQHAVILVAEGAAKAPYIEYELKSRLKRSIRMVVLGHVQRGGSPSASDRMLATRFGVAATQRLLAGERGKMVGMVGSRVKTTALGSRSDAARKQVLAHQEMLRLLT